MKPLISVLMPAIRKEKWLGVYEAIKKSTKEEFELIIVGPYVPDEEVLKHNVKYVSDYGSPMRASCIGALVAEGHLLTWHADDGLHRENSLDEAISIRPDKYNGVVINKYTEGADILQDDNYYRINNAYPRSPYIPDDWWIFNSAIMETQFYLDLGGWDASLFESCPCGHADLGARAYRAGAEVEIYNKSLVDCTHMPHTTGDHAPIHYATIENDWPAYTRTYSSPDCVNRIKIPLDNWKKTPKIWDRRFVANV